MSISSQLRCSAVTQAGSTDLELLACVDGFSDFLAKRGYAARTIAFYVRSLDRFTRWLTQHEVAVVDVDDAVMRDFLAADASLSRFAKVNSRAALHQFFAMRGATRASCQAASAPVSLNAAELEAFDRHLDEVRGLSPATRLARLRYVGAFLNERFSGSDIVQLCVITPVQVAAFVERYTAGWTPGSIRSVCNALRSYFAYRGALGDSNSAIAAALPQTAQWRLSGLPQALSHEEITQLLDAFDRDSATGRRDYAITRCLLDLGLRRSEVARLCLEDVDWHTGTVHIHGKGKRIDALPLPALTARAIVAYLQDGRPSTKRREIFVRHRPPLDAPADADIIRNAVRYAAARCGLSTRIHGTHILRHTLAEQLVQRGTRFKEIADLLRHRSLDTTAIYAKVDLPALAEVALPWPGRLA